MIIFESAGHVVLKGMIVNRYGKTIIVSDGPDRCDILCALHFEKLLPIYRCIEAICRKIIVSVDGFSKQNKWRYFRFHSYIFLFATSLKFSGSLILVRGVPKHFDKIIIYPMAATEIFVLITYRRSFLKIQARLLRCRKINQ